MRIKTKGIVAVCVLLNFASMTPSGLAQRPAIQHPFLSLTPSLLLNEPPKTQATTPMGRAFLKSLLLPGWGEASSGAKNRAVAFLTSEGVLWAAFAALKIYGHWKREDMMNFAVHRAGVNATGKSDEFYADLSNFMNIEEYNEEKRRFRQYDEVYPIDEDHFWCWQSIRDFRRFDNLYTSYRLAQRNATLVVGAVLLNHVVSAIDAVWVTHVHQKEITTSLQIDSDYRPVGGSVFAIQVQTSW